MTPTQKPRLERFLPALMLVAVSLAYSNHFFNEFQFDDGHAVVDNLAIRDLRNIPRMFVDGKLISALTVNQNYRPLTAASFAVDYALGGGLHPFFFHFSTYLMFMLQLLLVGTLLYQLTGQWRLAWLSASMYGLHPVCTQTVNYICQRSEVYVAAFLAMALCLHIRGRVYLALIPYALAALTKQNGLVLPALILCYEHFLGGKKYRNALPSIGLGLCLATLVLAMTPRTFEIGRDAPPLYWGTQPYVLLTYLKQSILPTDLVGDSDMRPFNSLTERWAIFGYLGIASILLAARRASAVIKFGLAWFFVAQAPTLIAPFSDVTNDHRMYAPFIGLCLIHCQLSKLRPLLATMSLLALPILGCLTYQRNQIWQTHEAFWYEVTLKAPGNGRGWMNYALSLMAKGRNEEALEALHTARPLTAETFSPLWLNFGAIYGALRRPIEAEACFKKAIEVDPGSTPLYVYGSWLAAQRRRAEAFVTLRTALAGNPNDTRPLYVIQQMWADAAHEANHHKTASNYNELATLFYLDRRYENALKASAYASTLDPKNPIAHNNQSACYLQLKRWSEAEASALKALKLDPTMASAKENLKKARYQLSQ